jgi:hypothetical protein
MAFVLPLAVMMSQAGEDVEVRLRRRRGRRRREQAAAGG